MPELPEVETIRRQLAPAVVGQRVVAAWTFGTPKFVAAPAAVGATITGLDRRGKYLLAALDDRRELVLHLGMTGRLWVTPEPVADPYLRAWWSLDGGGTLTFRDVRRFGRLAVVAAGDYATLPTLARLGPEPFGPQFTAAGLHRSLSRSTATVKTQLLSQRPVAGVGNIYADEALWRAAINPAARRVGHERAAALHQALRDVLAASLANQGTTFRDYRTAAGETGANQFHLDCYGRAGLPCRRCGAALVRRVIDGRGTTWCPRCQRR